MRMGLASFACGSSHLVCFPLLLRVFDGFYAGSCWK